MAVTLDRSVKVNMRALRAALTAVTPHAEPTKTKDEISPLCRVRLVLGKDEIDVMATCATTSAMASVEIVEDSLDLRFAGIDGPYVFDVNPEFCRKALQTFKTGKVTADAAEPKAVLSVGVDGFWSLMDDDGLVPGQLGRWPQLTLSDAFPDVRAILARALANASADPKGRTLVEGHETKRLFAAAGEAYGKRLHHEPVGEGGLRGWVVRCGPDFIGTLSSEDPGGDSLARADMERQRHLIRLGLADPDPDLVAQARVELGADVENLAGV